MLVEEVDISHTADINPQIHIENCIGIRSACSHQTAYNQLSDAVVRIRRTPSPLSLKIYVPVPKLKTLRKLPVVVDGRTISMNVFLLQKSYCRI